MSGFKIVGYGIRDGIKVPVVDGEFIFHLMDTEGLPFTVAQIALREQGMSYDVVGFCRAALASGNYSPDKLLATIREDADAPPADLIKSAIVRASKILAA